MNTTKHEVDTRVEAGAEKITTQLVINWDEISNEEIRALAAQSIVIKWQGQRRAEKSIPTEATIKASEYKLGTRAPRKPTDIMSMIAKLDPEARQALLAKLAE